MKNIKILDCTLRDGGYVNNWAFGEENSKSIISLLDKSNIDLIEIGFLNKNAQSQNQTLFNTFEKIEKFLPKNIDYNKLILMLNPRDFELKNIPSAQNSIVKNIRIMFKKQQTPLALDYCKKLKEKNYTIFTNPTFITQYNKNEFIDLINKMNTIQPYAFSIVDSMGAMRQKDVALFFELCNKYLDEKINICFHPHNNMQLAFSNVQHILNLNKNRNLIIDSSVLGMGRGAGNLNSELICQYLNEFYFKKYDISFLLKIIDENLKPIFAKNPWGYNIGYFLSAINSCHPNYAKFLIENNINTSKMDSILKSIPEDKKYIYFEELIKNLI